MLATFAACSADAPLDGGATDFVDNVRASTVGPATISGQVLSAEGAPVRGVAVALVELPDPAARTAGERLALHTRSGEEGRFTFESATFPGAWLVTVDPGGSGLNGCVVRGAGFGGERIDVGPLVAAQNGVVRGRIVDDLGQPVPGARVRAFPLHPDVFLQGLADLDTTGYFAIWDENPVRDAWRVCRLSERALQFFEDLPVPGTETAEDGSFRLAGVGAGAPTILVDGPGIVSQVIGPFRMEPAGDVAGEHQVTRGASLDVRVLAADGAPAAGVTVMAARQLGRKVTAFYAVGTTDADGRATIEHVGAGPHLVAALPPAQLSFPVVEQAWAASDVVELRLPAPELVRITGRGIDERTRAGLTVAVRVVPAPAPDAPQWIGGELGRSVGGWVPRLPAGRYRFVAWSDDGLEGEAVAELAGDETEIRVDLAQRNDLVIRVEDATGLPVEGVAVRLSHPTEPGFRAVTGLDGTAVIAGLPALAFEIDALRPDVGSAFGVAAPPFEPVRLTLTPNGAIDGQLTEQGSPVDDPWRVALVAAELPPWRWRSAVADADGRFRIEGIAAATDIDIELRRAPRATDVHRAASWMGEILRGAVVAHALPFEDEGPPDAAFRNVRLRAGETIQLSADVATLGPARGAHAWVEGTIQLDGRPASGLLVTAIPVEEEGNAATSEPSSIVFQASRTRTDELGSFRLAVPPAPTTLIAERVPPPPVPIAAASQLGLDVLWSTRVHASPDAVEHVAADLRSSVVSGTVTVGGVAASGVTVVAAAADGESPPRVTTVTDCLGRFRLRVPHVEQVEVRATSPGFVDGAAEFALRAGDVSDVQLELGTIVDTAFAQGRLVPGHGAPLLTFRALKQPTFTRDARPDAAGAFVVGPLVPGRYEVQFTPTLPLREPLFVDVPERGATNLELSPVVTRAVVRVKGSVQDPENDDAVLERVLFTRIDPPRNVVEAQFTTGRAFDAPGLVPGRYRVTCEATGAAYRTIYVEVSEEGVPEVRIPLLGP